MGHDLEAPGTNDDPAWDEIYRARGDDVSRFRPILTGDVFEQIPVIGGQMPKNIIILQHPCAIRLNGIDLNDDLLVAEVIESGIIKPSQWVGKFFKQLPLTELRPDEQSKHYVARFDKHHLTRAEDLRPDKRIACLSQLGINLLLQRWVHHNSRVVVPTFEYQKVTVGQFEEADVLEDWCFEREADNISQKEAAHEIDEWLSVQDGSESRRDRLKDEQQRSAIRQAIRSHLRALRSER